MPRERLRLTTARALGGAAVQPVRFALFHPTQLDDPTFPFAAFTEDTRTMFVEGISLAEGRPRPPPAELVYLGRPATPLRPIAYSTSSGLACAPTFTEAVLAALLELTERDAVMLAWKCRLSLPLLDWAGDEALVALRPALFRLDRPLVRRARRERLPRRADRDRRRARAPGLACATCRRGGSCKHVGEAWLKAVAEGFGVYRWLRQQTIAHARPGASRA